MRAIYNILKFENVSSSINEVTEEKKWQREKISVNLTDSSGHSNAALGCSCESLSLFSEHPSVLFCLITPKANIYIYIFCEYLQPRNFCWCCLRDRLLSSNMYGMTGVGSNSEYFVWVFCWVHVLLHFIYIKEHITSLLHG